MFFMKKDKKIVSVVKNNKINKSKKRKRSGVEMNDGRVMQPFKDFEKSFEKFIRSIG
jgi:hypothetical protein